jgi:hypothetical protein
MTAPYVHPIIKTGSTMSLYDQHKAAFDKVAADGFPHIAEAAKWFLTKRDYDAAIGFNSAVHHWISGRPASRTSDNRAKIWLDAQSKPNAPQSPPAVAVQMPQQAGPEGVILMVVASSANAERAKKMLVLLGCEVEVI